MCAQAILCAGFLLAAGPAVKQVLPGTGPTAGGTAVTISGAGFSSLSSVAFGDSAAMTVAFVSTGSLVAYSPPHDVGLVDVIVTTGSLSSSAGTQDTFLYPSPPSTTGTCYYGASSGTLGDDRRSAALATIQGASSSIYVATWNLSDPVIASALMHAASSGVSVSVVEDFSHRSGPEAKLAAAIQAQGGSVVDAPVPKQIRNNFISADGAVTAQGPYYLSNTAQQVGQRLCVLTGCAAADANIQEWHSLANGGVTFVPPPP